MTTMVRGACLILAGSVLGLSSLQAAAAATLPGAAVTGRIAVTETWCPDGVGACDVIGHHEATQTQMISAPGNYHLVQDSPSGESAISLDTEYAPSPYISLTGTYGANGSANYIDTGRLFGEMILQYYFMVTGPEDGPVSVHISARGGASGVDGIAQLSVYLYSWQALHSGESFVVDDDFQFVANQVNHVSMSAQIAGTCSPSVPGTCNGGSSSAYVDPVFTLGQDLLDQGYGLTFSAGVGNSATPIPPSGAPEPSAWALLIGGFGATGAMLRRRASQRSAAQS